MVTSVPNWYDYNRLWYNALAETSINFRVQACEGAYISLARYAGIAFTHAYEIGLGVEGNTKSLIKDMRNGNTIGQADGPVLSKLYQVNNCSKCAIIHVQTLF